MRLTLISGTTKVLLADHTDAVGGFDPEFSQGVQQATGIRAANGRPLARGNVAVALPFTVTRTAFTTLEAAYAYKCDHAGTVLALTKPCLEVETLGYDGVRQVRYLTQVAVESVRPRSVGVTVITLYQLRGAKFQKTNPEA